MTNEVDDPASAGDPRHPASARRGHRVHLLTVLLVATAVVLLIEVVAPLRELPAPRQISWWALIPLFCAAEVFVVHLQFRRDAHSFSLSELPLVAGFFFAPPLVVVLSMVAGTALALFFHRRQSPLKLAFNLANFTVANSVVAVLFVHLVDHHDPLSATSFLGVLLAILAGGVLQSLVILAAISLSEGRIDAAGIAATFGFTQAATVVNTCLALIGVRIVWENPAEIWLLAIPTIGVFIAYRFYVAEREKRDQVDFLYQSSKDLQRTATVDDAVAELLSKSCEVFRAERAEITFLPTRERDAVVRTAVDKEQTTQFLTPVTLDDAELQFMSRLLLDSPLLLSAHGKANGDPNGFLARRGLRDAMAVVLRGENNMVGTMLIANRLGEVTGFDDEDLRLLEMLANQTGVILERGRLQHSLSQLTVLQEQLRHEASHDPLTGMANRLLFGSRVDQALAQTGQHVGVLFIDIDDFKTVNDSLGHAAGDELLRAIADRIGQCLRPGDVAARLGGDEFAVLLIGIDGAATAVRIAERVIEALREPFTIATEEVLTHASIGIATAVDTGCNGQELLQNADLALYTAKSSGKSRWELFEPSMYAAVQHRHRLKADLYHAVESVEFELVYQPIVRVSTCSIVAAEALLRWRHPTRGTVLPDDFISLVEETGLITQLGAWVLHSACEEARDWPLIDGAEPVAVSVNVAVRQLREPDFVDSVRDVLHDTGLEAHRLILEVTEADIIYDTEPIIGCLNALRDLGVRIALDDFGTGHSSLSRLRDFPGRRAQDRQVVHRLTLWSYAVDRLRALRLQLRRRSRPQRYRRRCRNRGVSPRAARTRVRAGSGLPLRTTDAATGDAASARTQRRGANAGAGVGGFAGGLGYAAPLTLRRAVVTSSLISSTGSDPVAHARRRQRRHRHGNACRSAGPQMGAGHACKFAYGRFNGRFLNPTVTDHEPAAGRGLDAECRQRSDVDSGALGVPSDRAVVNPRGHAHDEMQSGSDALDIQFRQVPAERGDQAVSPPSVHAAGTPDMAVVVTAGQELREGELVESRREVVKQALGALHLTDQMRRNDEPAKAQSRRQCLRHGSDLYHVLRGNPLQRTHRFSVVSEFSVVVVLDDQAVVCARPGDQAAPSVAAQHIAGRELMRRGHEHSVSVKAVDDHALVIDRLRDDRKGVCLDALTRGRLGWVLNRDTRSAAPPEHAHEEIDALGCSLDDHDVGRIGDDPSGAAEMICEHLAEDAFSAHFAVVQCCPPISAGDVLRCRDPSLQREQRYLRSCWTQVVARRWHLWADFGAHEVASLNGGHNGGFTLSGNQESLRLELAVRIADHPA